MASLSKLIEDFRKLALASTGDVQFLIGSDEAIRHGHSLILTARSSYFERALNTSWRESSEGIFRKPNVEPEIFDIILEYMYTGQCTITMEILPHLAAAAHEMGMNELKMDCEEYACKRLTIDNACSMLDIAMQYGMFLLTQSSLASIVSNAKEIFETPGFVDLDRIHLLHILSLDSVNADELTIWKAAVRWALHQCHQNWKSSRIFKDPDPPGRVLVQVVSFEHLDEDKNKDIDISLKAYHGDIVIYMSTALHAQVCKAIAPLLRCIRFPLIPANDFFCFIEGTGFVPSDVCSKVYRHHAVSNGHHASQMQAKPRKATTATATPSSSEQ
ncbi:hypothetical protein BGZ73_004021 [Actinomortierella ambigua]|nr:hypothetical protein BGZ73_004021 [Actinomortierella ambigua]